MTARTNLGRARKVAAAATEQQTARVTVGLHKCHKAECRNDGWDGKPLCRPHYHSLCEEDREEVDALTQEYHSGFLSGTQFGRAVRAVVRPVPTKGGHPPIKSSTCAACGATLYTAQSALGAGPVVLHENEFGDLIILGGEVAAAASVAAGGFARFKEHTEQRCFLKLL